LEDGGGLPRNIHRLAAGGYDWMTVEVFLTTSTAWQRVATISALSTSIEFLIFWCE
jgi:hypothetical protein